MATLYVRNLSDSAVDELKIRAARRRQSLQAYARELLEAEAARPLQVDLIDQIRAHATVQVEIEEVLADIDQTRSRQ